MTEQLDRTTNVHPYPNRQGSWVSTDGKIVTIRDHSEMPELMADGPWIRIQDQDITRLRETYYRPYMRVGQELDAIKDQLRDIVGDE